MPLPLAKAAKGRSASLASYGDGKIVRLAELCGVKGAVIGGDSRVFDGGAVADWQ